MRNLTTTVLLLPSLTLVVGCAILEPGALNSDNNDVNGALVAEPVIDVEIVAPLQSAFLEGDTLWAFAERTTGSGFNWERIMELNEIQDEKKIDAGLVLFIPPELALDSVKTQ